jgi:hypothetical protein
MKLLHILFLALTVSLVSSCTTTPKQNDQARSAIAKMFVEPFTPLYDMYMLRSGAIDLLYCSASFHHKNERWPKDYAELSAFVKQSDGYLMLGEYERVDLKPLGDGGVEVCYVRPGHTNEMKFTLGNLLEAK